MTNDGFWSLSVWVAYPWTTFTAVCLFTISAVALGAMLYSKWRDTLIEHVALSGICFFGISRAYYAIGSGAVPWDMAVFSGFCAWWCLIKVVQHQMGLRNQRRRASDKAPDWKKGRG